MNISTTLPDDVVALLNNGDATQAAILAKRRRDSDRVALEMRAREIADAKEDYFCERVWAEFERMWDSPKREDLDAMEDMSARDLINKVALQLARRELFGYDF